MIIHLCSHFGDIEVVTVNFQTVIRYDCLTPLERRALERFFGHRDLDPPHIKGEIVLPGEDILEVGDEIGQYMHRGGEVISAVKLPDGVTRVKRGGLKGLWKKLTQVFRSDVPLDPNGGLHIPPVEDVPMGAMGLAVIEDAPPASLDLIAEVVEEDTAAVQVPMPTQGCPMPTMADLKEIKAAAVVRKFLTPTQQADFDKRRAFIALGVDSGRRYRVTSRWSPECERYGVLYDMEQGFHVCAYNRQMPPSEETLSMKFAVENFETEFLKSGHGGGFHID